MKYTIAVAALLVGLTLSLHAAGATATERRSVGKVDVLLTVNANQETGHVADLPANPDVPLADQRPGVVVAPGDLQLEHLSLQTTFHELRDGQTQHVIQLALVLVQQTQTSHAAQEGLTLEDTRWVLDTRSESSV